MIQRIANPRSACKRGTSAELLTATGVAPSTFWMRAVQFAGLARILHLVADSPGGIRARDLNQSIVASQAYVTNRGSPPAITTLYHCRNTLIRLGALIRCNRRFLVNRGSDHVLAILGETDAETTVLPTTARNAFAAMVLANPECQEHFFRLFTLAQPLLDVDDFRRRAVPVTWTATRRGKQSFEASLMGARGSKALLLSDGAPVRSILYGVRYWGRNELGLIDEYFSLGRGSVMFPVLDDGPVTDAAAVTARICSLIGDSSWTTFSTEELIRICCEEGRRPLSALFAAIDAIVRQSPFHVALIPTAHRFATITAAATLPGTQDHELRSYYHDASGRLISHIRFHRSLRSLTGAQHAGAH